MVFCCCVHVAHEMRLDPGEKDISCIPMSIVHNLSQADKTTRITRLDRSVDL